MKAAVYCATRNLYKDVLPSLKSVLKNTDIEKIYLLIEDDEFPEWLPDCVEVRNVSNTKLIKKSGPNYKNWWTYMVLLRGGYHKLFPDLDRILSLDVDTVVLDDVSELWALNMEKKYIAAVEEPLLSSGHHYVNAGVMFMNLEKLRDGTGDRILKSLNEKKWKMPEQDCYNHFCDGKVYLLPGDYNSSFCTAPIMFKEKIIHYPSRQDWMDEPIVQKYRNMSWEEVLEGRHA